MYLVSCYLGLKRLLDPGVQSPRKSCSKRPLIHTAVDAIARGTFILTPEVLQQVKDLEKLLQASFKDKNRRTNKKGSAESKGNAEVVYQLLWLAQWSGNYDGSLLRRLLSWLNKEKHLQAICSLFYPSSRTCVYWGKNYKGDKKFQGKVLKASSACVGDYRVPGSQRRGAV